MAELAESRGNSSATMNRMHGWAAIRGRFRLRAVHHSVRPLKEPYDFAEIVFDKDLSTDSSPVQSRYATLKAEGTSAMRLGDD